MAKILDNIRERAAKAYKTIVLPEGNEPRTVAAAAKIAKSKMAKVILLGSESEIKEMLGGQVPDGMSIVNPLTHASKDKYAEMLFQLRKSKGMTQEEAVKVSADRLYYGVLMVQSGDADGMVAGAVSSTGNVLRPALQIIKTAPGISAVSGCFVVVTEKEGVEDTYIFADCAVNPNPDADGLAGIALSSAATARDITLLEPRVAMLSYSTKGSAKHEMVDKVVAATAKVRELDPTLAVDGELQADAALVPAVSKLKSPGSAIEGKANVLVFPDLQSGNIGYKLVQRMAGAEAIGPICQGFNKPVNDLSRGCTVEDVINVVAITALQCK